MKYTTRLTLLLPLLVSPSIARGEEITATVETTLHTGSRQIRQFAFDGDSGTFFDSVEKPTPSDHFTLIFAKPVNVKSAEVVTGKPGEEVVDRLDSGTLEVSDDGETFTEAAKFADGEARCDLRNQPIRAIRIKPGGMQDHPLAIREIKVESDPTVVVFKYPIEFDVDCSDSPEMKDWADKSANLCALWYPRLNDALKSDGYKPATYIKMRISKDYKGVAAAGGGNIIGSTEFFKDHPEDLGAMIHETVHIIQNYHGQGNPGWLVEGVADYVRFFLFGPGQIGPISARRSHYNDSYRTTAAFLAYVSEHYDKGLVSKLNALMRAGKYKQEAFKELTGKTVQELDAEWRKSLQK